MAHTDHFLDFEKPVLDVVGRIREFEDLREAGSATPEKNLDEEIERLHFKEKTLLRRLYRNLSPWQKVQVARHPDRPQAHDFIDGLIEEFIPLAGDRSFADDPAMLAGLGRFDGREVAVLGTPKGHTTNERVKYNFGMPRPEGYRKARRIMELANRFSLPLITFVDTPGAYPGVGAEERGQGEAIASCIETLLGLQVPVITVVTGEGGSGGALAIATANRVLMLEHAIYSVISPEGCASILWRDRAAAQQAAEALKFTAQDLIKMRVVEAVIREPVGGAHRDYALTFKRSKLALRNAFSELDSVTQPLASARRERFLALT